MSIELYFSAMPPTRRHTDAMWKSSFAFFAAVSIALSAGSPAVFAQAARDGAAPPQLEKLEDVTPPKSNAPAANRPAERSGPQITQTREQGVVTDVQVKSGKSTYHLKPNTQAGTAVPGDAQSDTTRPAQWQILQFDWKRQQDKKAAAAAEATPAPPETQPKDAPAKK